MKLFDVIIVGSGASGVASALGLEGKDILMLDVGNTPSGEECLEGNLYDLKKSDPNLATKILGKNFESLNNIIYPYLNPKLKAPLNRFITIDAEKLSPLKSSNFTPSYSFAKGGMANAWGAGAFEFQDFELTKFPIAFSDLSPFYKELTDHIGISGMNDDLVHYLGNNNNLLPPPRKSQIAQKLYKRYERYRSVFNSKNFSIGHLRLAVLTKDKGHRQRLNYSNLDFYKPNIPAIYNPAFSLNDLIKKNAITYVSGYFVNSYEELDAHCVVNATNLKLKTIEKFCAKRVILAAGPINTSKIVLASNNDYTTKLPIQENAISYIPFVEPFLIGQPIEKRSVSASLGLVYQPKGKEHIWISLYGLSGPLKSEYIMDFPLSGKGCIQASKYFPSAMMIAQVFYPGNDTPGNWIKLNRNHDLEVNFLNHERGQIEAEIINVFRRIGFFSKLSFCKMPSSGNSFHYGCTLPMKKNPTHYQCNSDGLLFNTKHIYIADSSNFSYLPSKNLTFTMMANALRIARKIKTSL